MSTNDILNKMKVSSYPTNQTTLKQSTSNQATTAITPGNVYNQHTGGVVGSSWPAYTGTTQYGAGGSNLTQFSNMQIEISDFGTLYANDRALLYSYTEFNITDENDEPITIQMVDILRKAKIPFITTNGQLLVSKDVYETVKILMKMLFEGSNSLDIIAFLTTVARPNGKPDTSTPDSNP